MPRLISQCRANKDAVCRFASCPSGSAEWMGSNQFDHDLPDQAGWICSDPLEWICSTTELLICGCSRYAGRTDPHSVRTWGWVTSETAARQKFIGIQYFVAPSPHLYKVYLIWGRYNRGDQIPYFLFPFQMMTH